MYVCECASISVAIKKKNHTKVNDVLRKNVRGLQRRLIFTLARVNE